MFTHSSDLPLWKRRRLHRRSREAYIEATVKEYFVSSQKKHEQAEITALVKGVQDKDPAAFPALLACFSPLLEKSVNSFAKTTVLASAEKDDLLQEISLALYRAAQRFDLSQSKVTFGLYAKICIRNKLISAKRKLERKKRKKTPLPPEEPSGSAFSAEVFSSLMRRARLLLSQKEKTVLLFYLKGLSYDEIAKSLDCSVKSVDNALARAKRKLKNAVADTPRSGFDGE